MWNTYPIITRFARSVYYAFNCFCQSKISTEHPLEAECCIWAGRWQYKESPGNPRLTWMLGTCMLWLIRFAGELLVNPLWTVMIFVSILLNILVKFSAEMATPAQVSGSPPPLILIEMTNIISNRKTLFQCRKQRREVIHLGNTWRNFILIQLRGAGIEVEKH